MLRARADLDWVPDYAEGTPLDTATGLGTRQENVITWLREKGALSAESEEDAYLEDPITSTVRRSGIVRGMPNRPKLPVLQVLLFA